MLRRASGGAEDHAVFDIGLGELLLLAVLGLLVFGPDKLPKAAADAGRMIKQVRQLAANAKRDLADSAGLDLSEATNVVRDLADLHPRNLARSLFEETPSTTVGPNGAAAASSGSAGANGAAGGGSGTAAGTGAGTAAAGPSLAAAAAAYVPPDPPATGDHGAGGNGAGANGAGHAAAPSSLPTAATANAPASPPSATAFSMAVAASAGLLPAPAADQSAAAGGAAEAVAHRSPVFDPDAT